jgi:hypothetical protein
MHRVIRVRPRRLLKELLRRGTQRAPAHAKLHVHRRRRLVESLLLLLLLRFLRLLPHLCCRRRRHLGQTHLLPPSLFPIQPYQ